MDSLCLNPQCAQPVNPAAALRCQSCGADLRLNQRYRCVAVLGQGGFGRTYRAVDEGGQPPAICVVKQRWDSSPGDSRAPQPQHFWQEAQQLARLDRHPQIPRLLEVIDNAQGQFLVQEYIPGPNLDHLPLPLGEAQVRRLLADLLPVLQFIHAHGVIHRDIKPANIIAPPDDRPFVLVDFGAAKAVDLSHPSQTGTVIGSAGYAAPEQALGKAVFASDIFSLGLTCLHLLTGLHPFDLYAVGDDTWAWQPLVSPPLSPSLARVLDRMVNRRLRERYHSAQEVMADLRWGGLTLDQFPSQTLAPKSSPQIWEKRHWMTLVGTHAHAVAIDPHGRTLAAACADGSVRLWNCTNGEALRVFRKSLWGLGHRGGVTAVIFGESGVISGGEDGQVIRWPWVDSRPPDRLPIPAWQVLALALAPDGDTLAVACGDGRIYLTSLTAAMPPKGLIHHQAPVTALAVSCPDSLLVSGSDDRTIRLWSLPSGRLSYTLTAPTAPITALACHPQDGRIISGDSQGNVQVWTASAVAQGALIHRFSSPITALALSPNGHWLAIGTAAGHLTLVNLNHRSNPQSMAHDWSVTALAFTPDSRMVVSSGADETLRFWCLSP